MNAVDRVRKKPFDKLQCSEYKKGYKQALTDVDEEYSKEVAND